MGVFQKTVRLSNPWETTIREVEGYIDTGSRLCQVSEELAQDLQIVALEERRVRYADGSTATRPVAIMRVELAGMVSHQRTIIGPPGAPTILGMFLLEELGLGIDPVDGRLIPEIIEMLAQTSWPTI